MCTAWSALHCPSSEEGRTLNTQGLGSQLPPPGLWIFFCLIYNDSETREGKNITLTPQQRAQTDMLTLRIKFSQTDSLIFVSQMSRAGMAETPGKDHRALPWLSLWEEGGEVSILFRKITDQVIPQSLQEHEPW